MKSEAGPYVKTIPYADFDSIITLTLKVIKPILRDSLYTLIEGESIEWAGQTLSTAGVYPQTFKSSMGCDSTINLILSVKPKPERPQLTRDFTATICEGDSYDFYGEMKSEAGPYVKTIPYADFDSIITLTLIVHPIEVSDRADTVRLFVGQTYEWYGKTYSEAGDYTATLTNRFGCDSIAKLHVIITPKPEEKIDVVAGICDGGSYDFYGTELKKAGEYTTK